MITLQCKKKLRSKNEAELTLTINLSIHPGELVTLFGPSGAGKTTILRILAGLTSPDEGIVRVGDKTWFDSDKKINLSPQKRKIGFVFQDYALFPHMTVKENLAFALNNRRETAWVKELLATIGLFELANRFPPTLSGGQKQRVALARALVGKPKILLLDEPLSALDAQTRLHLQNEVGRLHRQFGLTTVLVSHDLAEVFKLSDRVFLLEQGEIKRAGTPGDIFRSDKISGKFTLIGDVIEIVQDEVVFILSIMIGNNLVRVASTEEELDGIQIGDTVIVASKSFNPIVQKL